MSQALPREQKQRGDPPRDAGALQDLLELAAEGLTLTQWQQDIRPLQQPEREQRPRGLQKAFIQSQQLLPPPPQRCFCKTVQLDSLAAALKEMVNNPHLSDVQFQVDSGEVIYAHMFVLYARSPQLLQFVDNTSFVVAEDGDIGARRVLLHDTPGEAVTSFLNYLYTADESIPKHLLLDVAGLAIRFGVRDLAVSCEDQQSEGLSGEEEEAGDGRDRAKTFEQLLKSMWLDENVEPVLKSVSRGDVISESMEEQELEEIDEIVTTQQKRTLDGVDCTKEGHSEGEIGQDGVSCPGKEPPRGMARKECKIKRDLESSRWKVCVNREEGLSELSTELQQDIKEMMPPGKSEALPSLSRASAERNHLESPGSPLTQFCFTEGKRSSSWETSIDIVKKETTSRNFLSLFRGPRKDLQMTFSSDLQAPVTFSQTHSLLPSASQPRRLSFQKLKQEQIKRGVPISNPEEPAGGLSPLQGNIKDDFVVVLDSEEELELGEEKKQEVEASDVSRQPSQGLMVSPADDGLSCYDPSPGSKVQDWLDLLVCNEAESGGGKSQELLDLDSHEEAWTIKEALLVPDTPLSARKGLNGSQLHSGLDHSWACERQGGPLPCSHRRLPGCSSPPFSLETGKPGQNPRTAEGDVVVVGDSEEEQDAQPPFPRGIFAGPFVTVALNARSPAGSSAHRFEGQDHPPVTVSSSIASTATTVHFGGADSHLQSSPDNWARQDSNRKEACLLAQRFPTSIPVLRPDLACQGSESPCIPPLMPYSAMGTPLLKKELRRFGVRALPKRQMVLKLKEIFQFTHQARTNSKKKATSVAARSPQRKLVSPCQLFQGSQTTKSFTDISGEVNWKLCSSESEFGWRKEATVSADRLPVGGSPEGRLLTASQESAGLPAASSETSVASQSSSAESAISLLAEKEFQASQDAAYEVQKLDVLQQYFQSNPSLCQQILLFQPIELSVLHAELKQNGVRIALDKLLDFLDANCITFTTAEARREKKQHFRRTKKKERRRR